MKNVLKHAGDPQAEDKLGSLRETYCNMLRYHIEGVRDPMQNTIYRDVLVSTYELADRLRLKMYSSSDGAPMYYLYRRQWRAIPGVSINVLMRQLVGANAMQDSIEETIFVLFNKIWLSDPFEPGDCDSIAETLASESLPSAAGCQIVSALLLSLMSYFDVRKLMLMLDAYDRGANIEIKARALTGALVIIYMYKGRLHAYPQIANRLAALAEQPGFTARLRTVTLRFILAKETEKITQRLQTEILPAMTKVIPDIIKGNLSEFDPETLAETNPEWKNFFAGSELGKSIEEYNRLQAEGADVMHLTFANLKSFDFFREVSNWFLPFMPGHSRLGEFADVEARQAVISLAKSFVFLCNSDKYSFALSVMRQSHGERAHILGQFHGHMLQMMEQYCNDMAADKEGYDHIIGQYIQDLYRFFKLYQFHKDFTDIFDLSLDFYNLPVLQDCLSDTESLSIFAEYHLKKNHFGEALALFRRLSEADPGNDMLLQKIGYCLQMGNIAEALEAYLKADIINSQSKWLTRRIASCFRALGKPDKAVGYYRRLEAWNPDNLSVQLSIGHCLLEQGAYAEALKYYFKVDYLDADGNGSRAWRPLAWCLFLSGRYEDAMAYYRKILFEGTKAPSINDFINAGHASWAIRKLADAVEFYRQAVQSASAGDGEDKDDANSLRRFMENFNNDIPQLLKAGISREEIPLVLDQLKFSL